MKEKFRHILMICLIGVLFFGLALWCWAKPQNTFSDSERRVLKSFPRLSGETLLSGDFMGNFESYAQDQFPLRDNFRSLKALSSRYVLRQRDNNKLYLAEDQVSRMEYPLSEAMLSHSAAHINSICDTYLQNHTGKVYFSVIPDKNFFLAERNGYPALDYSELTSYLRDRIDAEYIDITPLLSAEDYYRTDTHWRQEKITDVAQTLAESMGVSLDAEYTEVPLDTPFYGVYHGQSALPLRPDRITYLTNDVLEHCIVTSYDTGKPVPGAIYDFEKLNGKDAYEFFLSGAVSLMTIENPAAETDRELILFRDSFSGSLAPLLAEGYAKITLVDTRYISHQQVGDYVEFTDQDVLFLYSTILMNNSLALK